MIRHITSLSLIVLVAFIASDASAQNHYYPTDSSISTAITGNVVVGYANGSDLQNGTNRTSPTINLPSGGSVSQALFALNSSTVNIDGGYSSSVGTYDNSTINLGSGSIDLLGVSDNSTANILGGTVNHNVTLSSNSNANVSGGSIVGYLNADSTGTLNISGGNIGGPLSTGNTGTTNLTGGSISSYVQVSQNSIFNYSGGAIGSEIFVGNDAILNVFGLGLSASFLGDSGNPLANDAGNFRLYNLSGTLSDGSVLTNTLLYVEDEGTTAHFTLNSDVPEPGSAVLLAAIGLSGMGFAARYRRSARKTS